MYVRHDRIPRVRSGLGISILSTSRGVMTDKEARKQKVGGELLCAIW
jgi:small subunit ribosomal protein S8